jgi:hypothetical protein
MGTGTAMDAAVLQRTDRATYVSLGGAVAFFIVGMVGNALPGPLIAVLDILTAAALFAPMVVVALGMRTLLGPSAGTPATIAVAAAALASLAILVAIVLVALAVTGSGKGVRPVVDLTFGLAFLATGVYIGLETWLARRARFASRAIWWFGVPSAALFAFSGILIPLLSEAMALGAIFGLIIYAMWCVALPRMLSSSARGAGPGEVLPDDVHALHPHWLGWTSYLSAASFPIFLAAFIVMQAAYGNTNTLPPIVVIVLGLAAVLLFASMTAVGIGLQRIIEGGVPSLISLMGLAIGACALLGALVISYIAAIDNATSAPAGWALALALIPVGYGAWLVMANVVAMRNGHLVGRLPQVGILAGVAWILTAVLALLPGPLSFFAFFVGIVGYLVWSVWLGRSVTAGHAARPAAPASAPAH